MNADIIILAIVVFATFLMVFSKTHVAFVTFALCAGFVMSAEVGPGLTEMITGSSDSNQESPVFTAVTLVLLLFPALLIGYRFRRSQKGGGRFIQQIIPAFALSLLLVVFIFDFLPDSSLNKISDETYIYGQLEFLRSWIVLFAILTALFDVIIQHAGPPRPYHKKKE